MIELHTSATANGYKASIMLEECGLPYVVHAYDLQRGEQLGAGFLALNPVGRIPVIVDDDAPGGDRVVVYGTQAVLQYLAGRTGRFLPADAASLAQAYTWLGMVASDLAPAYAGQFAFNVLAREKLPWAIEFYDKLVRRLLAALDARLAGNEYLAGREYSIADIIAYPVAATSVRRYPGNLEDYPGLARWAGVVGARPAVQRGMRVPG